MNATDPPKINVTGHAEDAVARHAIRLSKAREALLTTPPILGWRSLRRRPSSRYWRVQSQLLSLIRQVAESGKEKHINAVVDAVALATQRPHADLSGAIRIWESSRADRTLFEDAEDWTIINQRTHVVLIWIMLLVATGGAMTAASLGAWPTTLIYSEAVLGGLLGCFLDWNRSKPRELSGGRFQQMFVRIFQPMASGFYGLLIVMALKSGILSLKAPAGSEAIYFFLAAVFAGYGGSHTMERLGKTFPKSD